MDYVLRERLLSELSRQHAQAPLNVARETWTHSSDGRCKLLLTWLLLRLRQAHPDLFLGGRYEALEVEGIGAPRTLAFLRASGETSVVVVVPRLVLRALKAGLGPVYGTTRVRLPPGLTGHRFRNLVTGATVAAVEGGLAVGPLLTDFPVAVLETTE